MPSDIETFESYRPLLFSIAYRMLGSAMDAEDIVQETYLRYQNAKKQDIQSPKAYLATITTRLCLDYLKSAKTQREDYIGTWLPEPIRTDTSPSQIVGDQESITIAFLVLLESLSPIERAVFLLREVFDYSYAEIAPVVGKREDNCRQYYQRAQQYIIERRPRFEPSSATQEKLVESFLQALTTGDVETLKEVLVEDVELFGDGGGKARSIRQPIIGRDAVVRFLVTGIYRQSPPDIIIEIVKVNGIPAICFWQQEKLLCLMTFSMAANRIEAIRNILNPDKLIYFQRRSSLIRKNDR